MPQQKLYRNARVWSMYVDLVEALGTFEESREVYNQMIGLKVASSQVILNWSEAIDYYGNGEDFRLYQSGTLRTITAASYAGSQLSLTVSPAINAGTTVTLDYVDNGNLYDYAGNPPANRSPWPASPSARSTNTSPKSSRPAAPCRAGWIRSSAR